MVPTAPVPSVAATDLSVLALSSRFDGRRAETRPTPALRLSVLALSSRFDGRRNNTPIGKTNRLSVLALSSRFDGHDDAALTMARGNFQYSLCRVVLMV